MSTSGLHGSHINAENYIRTNLRILSVNDIYTTSPLPLASTNILEDAKRGCNLHPDILSPPGQTRPRNPNVPTVLPIGGLDILKTVLHQLSTNTTSADITVTIHPETGEHEITDTMPVTHMNTISMINGDILGGSLWAEHFKGESMLELLNDIQPTIIGIGNHEFDYGSEQLESLINRSKFGWLGENIFINDDPDDVHPDSTNAKTGIEDEEDSEPLSTRQMKGLPPCFILDFVVKPDLSSPHGYGKVVGRYRNIVLELLLARLLRGRCDLHDYSRFIRASAENYVRYKETLSVFDSDDEYISSTGSANHCQKCQNDSDEYYIVRMGIFSVCTQFTPQLSFPSSNTTFENPDIFALLYSLLLKVVGCHQVILTSHLSLAGDMRIAQICRKFTQELLQLDNSKHLFEHDDDNNSLFIENKYQLIDLINGGHEHECFIYQYPEFATAGIDVDEGGGDAAPKNNGNSNSNDQLSVATPEFERIMSLQAPPTPYISRQNMKYSPYDGPVVVKAGMNNQYTAVIDFTLLIPRNNNGNITKKQPLDINLANNQPDNDHTKLLNMDTSTGVDQSHITEYDISINNNTISTAFTVVQHILETSFVELHNTRKISKSDFMERLFAPFRASPLYKAYLQDILVSMKAEKRDDDGSLEALKKFTTEKKQKITKSLQRAFNYVMKRIHDVKRFEALLMSAAIPLSSDQKKAVNLTEKSEEELEKATKNHNTTPKATPGPLQISQYLSIAMQNGVLSIPYNNKHHLKQNNTINKNISKHDEYSVLPHQNDFALSPLHYLAFYKHIYPKLRCATSPSPANCLKHFHHCTIDTAAPINIIHPSHIFSKLTLFLLPNIQQPSFLPQSALTSTTSTTLTPSRQRHLAQLAQIVPNNITMINFGTDELSQNVVEKWSTQLNVDIAKGRDLEQVLCTLTESFDTRSQYGRTTGGVSGPNTAVDALMYWSSPITRGVLQYQQSLHTFLLSSFHLIEDDIVAADEQWMPSNLASSEKKLALQKAFNVRSRRDLTPKQLETLPPPPLGSPPEWEHSLCDLLLPLENKIGSSFGVINGGFLRGDKYYPKGSNFTLGNALEELPFPKTPLTGLMYGEDIIRAVNQQVILLPSPTGSFPHFTENVYVEYTALPHTHGPDDTAILQQKCALNQEKCKELQVQQREVFVAGLIPQGENNSCDIIPPLCHDDDKFHLNPNTDTYYCPLHHHHPNIGNRYFDDDTNPFFTRSITPDSSNSNTSSNSAPQDHRPVGLTTTPPEIPTRVVSLQIDGHPIHPHKLYLVTTTQFIMWGGDGLTSFLRARLIHHPDATQRSKVISDVFIDYLNYLREVHPDGFNDSRYILQYAPSKRVTMRRVDQPQIME